MDKARVEESVRFYYWINRNQNFRLLLFGYNNKTFASWQFVGFEWYAESQAVRQYRHSDEIVKSQRGRIKFKSDVYLNCAVEYEFYRKILKNRKFIQV